MKKHFLTYEQQIEKLEFEKGLVISDHEYATNILKQISYYSLIGGYKDIFKHKPSGKFLYGVTFEEIVTFYNFDKKLRILFLEYILQIERLTKSLLSYAFCEKYGDDQQKYLDTHNYNVNPNTEQEINRLIASLHTAVSLPTHYPYIAHYVSKYHNVPLWVAMNALTLGQVSKMYQYLTSDIRSAVSLNFKNVNETELHHFIRIIARCRNVCAHGERLYSFSVQQGISDMPLHQKLNIPVRKGHYICGTNDLFAIVIAFRYLLNDTDFSLFQKQLELLISTVLHGCIHIEEKQLLTLMGFPCNWKNIK